MATYSIEEALNPPKGKKTYSLNEVLGDQPHDFDALNMVKNIPASGWNLLKDMTYPLRHPIDFKDAIGTLVTGAYEKFTPGVQPEEEAIDSLGQMIVDRYGSWDNIKRTTENDPVGILSDAAGVLTLGGAALPTKAGKVASTIGKAIDPLNLAVNSTKPVIAALPIKHWPAEMYKKTVKTSFPKKSKGLDDMIETALDEGIPPSTKGVNKLDSIIDGIDNNIEELISQATTNGGKVNADAVFVGLKKLRQDIGSAVNPDGIGNVNKINETARKLGLNQKMRKKEFYTIEELQELKRRFYKEANFDVKQNKADPAINQARKEIAKGAKDLIEQHIPEVAGLNKRWGKLIELQDPLETAARRIEGNNVVSINQPLNTGIAYQLGGPGLATATSFVTALGNPKIRPEIAIWLRKLHNQGLLSQMTDNNLLPVLARQGLLQTGRATSDQTSKP